MVIQESNPENHLVFKATWDDPQVQSEHFLFVEGCKQGQFTSPIRYTLFLRLHAGTIHEEGVGGMGGRVDQCIEMIR